MRSLADRLVCSGHRGILDRDLTDSERSRLFEWRKQRLVQRQLGPGPDKWVATHLGRVQLTEDQKFHGVSRV